MEAGLGRSAADMQGRAAGLATGGRADTEMAAGGLASPAMGATMARREGECCWGLAGQCVPDAVVLPAECCILCWHPWCLPAAPAAPATLPGQPAAVLAA